MRIWIPSVVLLAAVVVSPGVAAADVPCDRWQQLSPYLPSAGLEAVTLGALEMVAVGRRGTVLYANSEVGWRPVPSPTGLDLLDVAFLNGRLVAVGAAGMVITSDDGWTWRRAERPSAPDLAAVAAGPPGWVAVGSGGTVLTSDDGLTWQQAASGTDVDLVAVVWRGSEFLAAGADGTTASSPDGTMWAVHGPVAEPIRPVDLASDGVRTVMAASGSHLVSTDGRTWERIADLGISLLTAVTWTGDRFVATAEHGAVWDSSDGVSWRWLGPVFGHQTPPRDVAGFGDALVVVGDGGAIAMARDGSAFEVVSGATALPLEAVAHRDGTTVVVGGDGWPANAVALRSTDGTRFETTYEFDREKLLDVTATSDGFVMVGGFTELVDSPILKHSTDGSSWVDSAGAGGSGFLPSELESVTAVGDRVMAVGDDSKAAWSLDGGVTWTYRTLLDERGAVRGVASDGLEFVVVGELGSTFTTFDGSDWVEHSGATDGLRLRAVAWGGAGYIAVGERGAAAVSVDGRSWTVLDTGVANDLLDIVWTGEAYVAVGGAGAVVSTADGGAWSFERFPPGTRLSGVAFDGTDLLVTGGRGVIARSACDLPTTGPTADFTWSPATVRAGRAVRFWDLSVGAVDDREWRFGDGQTSFDPSPTHVFRAAGSYEVELEVSGDGVVTTATATVVVEPGVAPVLEERSYLAGVAHLRGLNQTVWRTDLELCRLAPGDATVELAMLLRDRANPDPATVVRTVPGGGCTRLVDVVASAFGLDDAAGAIRVRSDLPIVADARTYNDLATGSFGSHVAAVAPADAATARTEWAVVHMSESADPATGARTNLALLNLSPSPLELEVELYAASGARLATLSETLEAYEYTQLVRVLAPHLPVGMTDGYARVRAPASGARFVASASLVDNRSGDAITVPATPVPG